MRKRKTPAIELGKADIELLRDILVQGHKICGEMHQPQAADWLRLNCMGALTRYEVGRKKEVRAKKQTKTRLRNVRTPDGRPIAKVLDVPPESIVSDQLLTRGNEGT